MTGNYRSDWILYMLGPHWPFSSFTLSRPLLPSLHVSLLLFLYYVISDKHIFILIEFISGSNLGNLGDKFVCTGDSQNSENKRGKTLRYRQQVGKITATIESTTTKYFCDFCPMATSIYSK